MGGGKKGADVSRAARKAKKRKLEDAIPDVPGDNDIARPELMTMTESNEPPKKRKRDHDEDVMSEDRSTKDKKKKKRGEKKDKKKDKKSIDEGESGPEVANAEHIVSEKKPGAEADNAVKNEDVPRKSKKERKAERRAREAAEATAKEVKGLSESNTTGPESSVAPVAIPGKDKNAKKDKKKQDKKNSNASETQQNTNGEKSGRKGARFIVFIGKSLSQFFNMAIPY